MPSQPIRPSDAAPRDHHLSSPPVERHEQRISNAPTSSAQFSSMASVAPRSGVGDGSARDAYALLLATGRPMRRDHAIARDAWLASLEIDRKVPLLFELETTLKGLVCFASPRNHPGFGHDGALSQHDFRSAGQIARDGVERTRELARTLLHQPSRAFVYQRYFEHVAPVDGPRSRIVRPSSGDESAQEALLSLRHSLAHVGEVIEGLLVAPRVPFRGIYAALGLLHREVAHNTFFNPMQALEFRPELDRIESGEVLAALRSIGNDETQRLFALTFLSLFRLLRYLELAESTAATGNPQLAYLTLATLRSDARALCRHITANAGRTMSEGFDREIFAGGARTLDARFGDLIFDGERMITWRNGVESAASKLRLEVRRAFERNLPAVDSNPTPEELRVGIAAASQALKPAIASIILYLCRTVGTRIEADAIFSDASAQRAVSERSRRDVWMFAQIVRGFAAKAAATRSPERADRWTSVETFRFVREFLVYFRILGYPLLRANDYPRFEKFLAALTALSETDFVDPARMTTAIAECEAFHVFLMDLFESVGRRAELSGRPFDRRAAAQTLKTYLADAKN